MNFRWISKDNGTCHIYVGAKSICGNENMLKLFARKHHFEILKEKRCGTCARIIQTNQVKTIIESIDKINDNTKKFHKEFGMYPVDALLNKIGHTDTDLKNSLWGLSAKDFGEISPEDVLAKAITTNQVVFDDNGNICMIEPGEGIIS
ncbi:MAG: hypothetical protein HRO68_07670 [Nitrosopumilus sp.]|nr:hypothetical protein [Nitrosopumilus sp.]